MIQHHFFTSIGLLCGSIFVFCFWVIFNFEDNNIVGKMMMVLWVVSFISGIFFILKAFSDTKIKLSKYDNVELQSFTNVGVKQ